MTPAQRRIKHSRRVEFALGLLVILTALAFAALIPVLAWLEMLPD